jgi:hypothetical protein
VEPPAEAPKPAEQPEQIASSIFPDAPTKAWQDTVAQIVSAPPAKRIWQGHLRDRDRDREFEILSWIAREVDFTQGIVWIEAHLRILVETHRPKGDVYESLIFRKNLFAPQTDSPIIEYPQGGDLVSKDGVVYLANDWFPSLVADRPVEVVTLLGVEFHQFDLPKAPVAAVEPPAEAPEVPVGVTGFVGVSLNVDEYEWRVPDANDIGKIVEVRDSGAEGWHTRRLMAVLGEYDGKERGQFVCKGDTICYPWRIARISNKQQPEAPKKRRITSDDVGKQVFVTHRKDGYEDSFVRVLVSLKTRPQSNMVEYGLGRSIKHDVFSDILFINPDDPESEYQIRLLDQ